jgi:hypothetical protein
MTRREFLQMLGLVKKDKPQSKVRQSVIMSSNGAASVKVMGNVRGGITISNRRVWIGGKEYKPGDTPPEGVTIIWG